MSAGNAMTTKPAFSRILVPVDFSSLSERAWETAERLADSLGAELLLLHVLVWEDTFRSLEGAERAAERRTLHAEAELNIGTPESEPEVSTTPHQWSEDLLAKWAAHPRGAGIAVRTLLRAGTPQREIVTAAREEGADLIVMGTHGWGRFDRLLIGSVTDGVVRTAACPVLVCTETAGKKG
jgi:nucleotide-binding universal stress UspA family protein